MDKFLIRAGSSQAPDHHPSHPGPENDSIVVQAQPQPPKKKKKLVVANKSTVKSWGFDWLESEMVPGRDGGKGGLRIHCVACRQYVPKTSRNNRGSVSNDPYIVGTNNIKKFSAVRHSQSQGHVHAYGKKNLI